MRGQRARNDHDFRGGYDSEDRRQSAEGRIRGYCAPVVCHRTCSKTQPCAWIRDSSPILGLGRVRALGGALDQTRDRQNVWKQNLAPGNLKRLGQLFVGCETHVLIGQNRHDTARAVIGCKEFDPGKRFSGRKCGQSGNQANSKAYAHQFERDFISSAMNDNTMQREHALMEAYRRHAAKTIFTARHVMGVRAAAFLTAGIARVPFWKFILVDGAAAMIGVPIGFALAYFFTDQLEEILTDVPTSRTIFGSTTVLPGMTMGRQDPGGLNAATSTGMVVSTVMS